MYYSIPECGQVVQWAETMPATVLRFTGHSIALLHFSATVKKSSWLNGAVTIGVTSPLPGLPLVAAQIGTQDAIAAPACIYETGSDTFASKWLFRAVSPYAEIHLILLEPGPLPGQAQVAAVRVVEDVYPLLDSLRGQLQDQYVEYPWEEAGMVQQAGRQLQHDNSPYVLLLEAWPPVHEPPRTPQA